MSGTPQQSLKSKPRRDGQDDKRFPNSISALMRTVYRYWLVNDEPEKKPLSVSEFLSRSDFPEKYMSAAQRFPGTSRMVGMSQDLKTVRINQLQDLIDNLARGVGSNLDYLRLRSLSDFLGISDSALLIFTMLMSIERRSDDMHERTVAMSEFLNGIDNAINEARTLMEDFEGRENIFSKTENETDTGKAIWIGEVDSLRRFVSAYQKDGQGTLAKVLDRE